MTPTAADRQVHPLTNPTAIASRLRWLAAQISTESQLLDRASQSRKRMVGLAFELGYQARVVDHGNDLDLAREWIAIATNTLVTCLLNRTDLGGCND